MSAREIVAEVLRLWSAQDVASTFVYVAEDVVYALHFDEELAPYAGVVWHQKHFGTADLARANGESTGGARFVAGLRFWM